MSMWRKQWPVVVLAAFLGLIYYAVSNPGFLSREVHDLVDPLLETIRRSIEAVVGS